MLLLYHDCLDSWLLYEQIVMLYEYAEGTSRSRVPNTLICIYVLYEQAYLSSSFLWVNIFTGLVDKSTMSHRSLTNSSSLLSSNKIDYVVVGELLESCGSLLLAMINSMGFESFCL